MLRRARNVTIDARIICESKEVRILTGCKRGVIGTYHKLSVKHLDAYLDELEHRFNNRSNKFLFRDTLLKLVKAEKLPYAELTKAA